MSRNPHGDGAKTVTIVTPRERRVSRNFLKLVFRTYHFVTPRERRVSRNGDMEETDPTVPVTPRERRVSRNQLWKCDMDGFISHASREACE